MKTNIYDCSNEIIIGSYLKDIQAEAYTQLKNMPL